MPPNKWAADDLATTCNSFLHLIEVYVDDFIGVIQSTNASQVRHMSRALLHSIHDVFPPPSISKHNGGDPISLKKLMQGDGVWSVQKEILGWVFHGVKRCIHLPPNKIASIKAELHRVCRMKAVPLKTFESLVGKLRHAAIGMPSGNGLCQPFNQALAHRPAYINLGKKGAV